MAALLAETMHKTTSMNNRIPVPQYLEQWIEVPEKIQSMQMALQTPCVKT